MTRKRKAGLTPRVSWPDLLSPQDSWTMAEMRAVAIHPVVTGIGTYGPGAFATWELALQNPSHIFFRSCFMAGFRAMLGVWLLGSGLIWGLLAGIAGADEVAPPDLHRATVSFRVSVPQWMSEERLEGFLLPPIGPWQMRLVLAETEATGPPGAE